MLLDMDVKSHGLLATRSPLLCCCGRGVRVCTVESIALAPALCESLFGRLLRLETEKLSIFAFNPVVNAQWQCM